MTDLYIDIKEAVTVQGIKKTGAEARLSDNADQWPHEVLAELHKQHPYVGVYNTIPHMENVDNEQGYGLGYIILRNRSTQLSPEQEKKTRAPQGIREIRIPVIVKNQHLFPLDVFFTASGKAQPLTDLRLRAALYRPQLFDIVKKSPGDTSLYEQLYPPASRQNLSAGGLPYTKVGHKKESGLLLQTIAPTISKEDLYKFANELNNDFKLKIAVEQNKVTKAFFEFLSKMEPTTSADIQKVASAVQIPNVVQIERMDDHYRIKVATSESFDPEVADVDRAYASSIVGDDAVVTADEQGVATISTNPVVHDLLEDEQVEKVKSFGQYKVKTVDNKEIMGWVFPKVLDFDGAELPLTIFTNGSQSAIQESIVGSFVGAGPNIIRKDPEGHGFFYKITSSGSVLAFQPIEIQHSFEDNRGTGYRCNTILGDTLDIKFNGDIKTAVKLDDTQALLPSDVQWAPLADTITRLIDNAGDFVKISSAFRHNDSSVTILSDGTNWILKGEPLSKIASYWRDQLTAGDALFTCCALGLEPKVATRALIKSATMGSVTVHGCRQLQLPKDKLAAARIEAKQMLSDLPTRYVLIKEAAALSDITTVDKVLSLGFLNPENVNVFIKYLPDIEKTIEKLAHLLVATRLGIEDVPESSVKSALTRLDEVANGLKKLIHRQTTLS